MTSLDKVLEQARSFAALLAETDRKYRKAAGTVPEDADRARVVASFWELMQGADRYEREHGASAQCRASLRELVGAWFWRSRFWNRSFHKPHGYAGDFTMIEWMYELEGDPCVDPTQPAIVNLLDHLYWTVDSVQAVCERRRFFAELLRREHDRRDGSLRVLDLATGGARYLRDYLATRDAGQVEVTIVDQDPAAIAFCEQRSLAAWRAVVSPLCVPIRQVATRLDGSFDVILSAGLFDYLDDSEASALLDHLSSRSSPDGVIAISNFHPADRSAVVKSWITDWHLRYRDEAACSSLFADRSKVTTRRSQNGSLVYALVARPGVD